MICTKRDGIDRGTLHLTAHHLIFNYDDSKTDEEMWVSTLINEIFSVNNEIIDSVSYHLTRDEATFDDPWEITYQHSV